MSGMKLIMKNWNNFVISEQLITEAQKKEAVLILEDLYKKEIISEGLKDELKKFLKKGAPKAAALALALTSFLGATGEAQATIAVPGEEGIGQLQSELNQNSDNMPHFEMQDGQLVLTDYGARGVAAFILNGVMYPNSDIMYAVRRLGGSGPFFEALNDFMEKANSGEIDELNLQNSPLFATAVEILKNGYLFAIEDGEEGVQRDEVRQLQDIFKGEEGEVERLLDLLSRSRALGRARIRNMDQPPQQQSGD